MPQAAGETDIQDQVSALYDKKRHNFGLRIPNSSQKCRKSQSLPAYLALLENSELQIKRNSQTLLFPRILIFSLPTSLSQTTRGCHAPLPTTPPRATGGGRCRRQAKAGSARSLPLPSLFPPASLPPAFNLPSSALHCRPPGRIRPLLAGSRVPRAFALLIRSASVLCPGGSVRRGRVAVLPSPALAPIRPPFLAGPAPVSWHAVPSGGRGPVTTVPPPLLAPGRVARRLRRLWAGSPRGGRGRGQRSFAPGHLVSALPRPGCWPAASGLPLAPTRSTPPLASGRLALPPAGRLFLVASWGGGPAGSPMMWWRRF
ncbi:uncharacterized protein LOC112881209 [Panicum hallii]|uniref:uncharacterized protein LOC112881209 n=1 Tax=Panicum hallii TaxID=206008 RepID=UPI000DF4EAEE|nr:uncharacterized protein LOC112881209 [Panicum hallii]